jgi:hypothetical protein
MLREVVRCNSIVSRHCGCAAAKAARSILADEAGGIAATAAVLAKLFKPAAFSSYQLSGPAVWEQLSGPAAWEQLSGPAVWEQLSGPAMWGLLSGPAVWGLLSGPAVWAAPGGLERVSATTFSLPGMYLMSAVNSAT